ncbi:MULTISPECIES: DUF2753 family protein [unclassified Bosea (in: a-proteobacteria)]|uniref:DUF2753 family protein n=1 Tax=unclassified Bosea (in: a-proteobacteria) TaxID=2653178 RepID=UPI00125EF495|nr:MULTISPECIES: DUF2753 family protein [unclassified Bosea (in: a-proteobacteria)]
MVDDAEWTRLTVAANDAFRREQICEALLLYRDALAEAERLFCNTEIVGSPVSVATIYVISCQNLAEAARLTGEPGAAERWSLQAFERLAAAAESPATPLSLRLDCMRDLKFAFLNLVEGRREDVAFHLEMERLLARGRGVVACVMGVVERLATLPAGELRLFDSVTGRPS